MDYEKLYKELLKEKESLDLKLKEYEGLQEKYDQTSKEVEDFKKSNSDLKIELYDLYRKKQGFEKEVEFSKEVDNKEESDNIEVLGLDDLVSQF